MPRAIRSTGSMATLRSSDFIYVTTQTLRHDQLQQLSDEVGEHRSLLVMCASFRGKPTILNLTIKKIPKPSSPAANGATTITASRWKTFPKPLCNQDKELSIGPGGRPLDRQVNAIAGRLSLRPPQRRSLEILDRVTEIVPPQQGDGSQHCTGHHP